MLSKASLKVLADLFGSGKLSFTTDMAEQVVEIKAWVIAEQMKNVLEPPPTVPPADKPTNP